MDKVRPKSASENQRLKESSLPCFKFVLASRNGIKFLLYELSQRDIEYRLKVNNLDAQNKMASTLQERVRSMMNEGLHRTVGDRPDLQWQRRQ